MGQCRRLLLDLTENIARQRRRQALAPATASGPQRHHFRPHAAQLVLQLPVAGAFLAQLLLHLAVSHHEVAVGSVLLVGLMMVAAEELVGQAFALPPLTLLHLLLQEVDELGLLGNRCLVPCHLARYNVNSDIYPVFFIVKIPR